MAKRKLSRRNFLQITGASAALAASGLPLGHMLHAAPPSQDATSISFAGWGGTAEQAGVEAAIAKFQEENPSIQVEWLYTPDTEFTRVFLSDLAAGTPPDTSFIMSNTYETFRQEGILMDITDRIKSDPLLGKENYFLEPQESDRCADADGRWHGIGSCWVAPHLYYNAELFDDAGIEPPGFKDDEIWDWDTFVEIAKQLTADSKGRHPDDAGFDPEDIVQWGVQYPFSNETFIAAAVYSNGGALINENGSGLDSPEAMEALQNLTDLMYVHHVSPRSAALSGLGMTNTQMLDTGRLAMAVDGSWALSWMNSSTVSVPMGTGALPKMTQPATFMQAHFHSALASTQHPDEAWQWIRFLATPFYQTQFCKIGLWLPSQTDLMTEEGLATWMTEGIHPDNYRDFVTEYLLKYGVTTRIPAGYVEATLNFISPAYEAMNNGSPAVDVLPEAVRQANEIIAAAQM